MTRKRKILRLQGRRGPLTERQRFILALERAAIELYDDMVRQDEARRAFHAEENKHAN